jgi:hypothetical protein
LHRYQDFGSEVTEDGGLVDVRGRYHPGWCAPRVVSSTPAEITRTFDALFSGQLLAADMLRRMLTLVPLPELQSPPMVIGARRDLIDHCQVAGAFLPGVCVTESVAVRSERDEQDAPGHTPAIGGYLP